MEPIRRGLAGPGWRTAAALALLLGASAAPRAQADEGRRIALVVGVDDPRAPGTRSAERDAEAVYRLFVERLGFDRDRSVLLLGTEANPNGMLRAMSGLSRTSPADQLVVYYAGPAETTDLPDGSHLGVLRPGVPPASDEAALYGRAYDVLSLRTLEQALRVIPASRTLVVLDAALGGTLSGPAHSDGARPGPTRHLLVAAGAGESVADERDPDGLAAGALARALARGLGDGAADADGDGRVAADELAAFVRAEVPALTGGRQRPYFRAFAGSGEGVSVPVPACSVPTLRAQAEAVRRWALVIGADAPSAPSPRPGAEADAEAVRRLLVERLGVDRERVRLLLGAAATPRAVLRGMDWLTQAAPEDEVVVYYAGPVEAQPLPGGGHVDVLLTDSSASGPDRSLPVRTLEQALGIVPARRALLVLDAPLGASAVSPAVGEASGAARPLILAAGAGEPVAAPSGEGAGSSALARALARGLGDGAADADGDGRVAAGELAAFVRAEVPALTGGRQHPHVRQQAPEREGVSFLVPVCARPAPSVPPRPSESAGPGTLRVTSTPTGAAVTVDGRPVGVTPLEVPVPAGEALVVATLEGHPPSTHSVFVEPVETVELRAALAAITGSLVLRGLPDGLAVAVDGRPVEDSGAAELPGGTYRVAVTLPDGRVVRRSVRIVAGESVALGFRPRVFRSTYLVRSIVPGLGQLLDGAPLKAVVAAAGLTGAVLYERGARVRYERELAAYEARREEYRGAQTEEDAARLRELAAAQFDEARGARRHITVGLFATGAAYALTLLDAYLHHMHAPVLDVRTDRSGVALAPAVLPTGEPAVGLSIRL